MPSERAFAGRLGNVTEKRTTRGDSKRRLQCETESLAPKRFKADEQENIDPLARADQVQDPLPDVEEEFAPSTTVKIFRLSHAQKAVLQHRPLPNDFPKNVTSRKERKDLVPIKNTETMKLRGSNTCFVCENTKNMGTALVRCEGHFGTANCKLRFHPQCAPEYNADGISIVYSALPECQNKVLCPLEACSGCLVDCRHQRAYIGRIIQCMSCLRGFHQECIPAGAVKKLVQVETGKGVIETVEMIICPSHYVKEIVVKKHLEICGKCEKETDLKNCTKCIQSFHPKCREVETINETEVQDDLCNDCASETSIRKGTLVIFDNGRRFILAKTTSSDNSKLGFVSLDLGKNKSISAPVSSIAPMKHVYTNKLTKIELKNWKDDLDKLGTVSIFKPLFRDVLTEIRTIKITSTVPPRKKIDDLNWDDMDSCEDYKMENCECPRKCRGTNGRCTNQDISRQHINPKMLRERYETKGFGVRASEVIHCGEFLGEFAGEVLSREEHEERFWIKVESKDIEAGHYFFQINPTVTIDASRMGNITRYINHSCNPNAVAKTRWVFINRNTIEKRIFIETLRKIEKDEEITLDYQWDATFMNCYCGEDNCISKKTL